MFRSENADQAARGITRRSVLSGAAATGVVLASGGLKANAQQQPKRGGVLRIGMGGGGGANVLDPQFTTGPFPNVKDLMLFSYLFEIERDGRTIPNVVESWSAKEKSTEWVFKLRRNIEFHNGKSLVAADVIYSLNRHRVPGTKSTGATFLRPVTEIRADGTDTVIVKTSEPYPDLPTVLAVTRFAIIPDGFDDWSKPIGSGPYVFKSLQSGVQLIAERNPNYWKAGRGWFDAVELTSINDSTARLNALLTGKIDVMNRVETRAVNCSRA